MGRVTLVVFCLALYIVSTLSQFTVTPQICSQRRTRRAWGIRWMCVYRRTCYGPRLRCYRKCFYYTQEYYVPVCCAGYRSYPQCNVPICQPRCQNNGLCVAKDNCDCPQGWTGPTCTSKQCSWATDCYPGTCIKATTKCQCASGFGGGNCQTMKEGPIFDEDTCEASLVQYDKGSYKSLETVKCAPGNENDTSIYTNKATFSHVGVHAKETYNKFEDTPDYPSDGFLRNFKVGIIEASVDIILKDTGGTVVMENTLDCSNTGSNTNPQEAINCEKRDNFTEGVKHLQELDIVINAKTGGTKEIRNQGTSGTYVNRNFAGQSGSRKLTFKFDLEPPYHCEEDGSCCDEPDSCTDGNNYLPLSTLDDITDSPDVTLVYLGWQDKDSQPYEYRYSVYEMTLNGEGKLQEDEKPVLTGNFTLFDKRDDISLVLPRPGLYSIIGEVIDFASNVRHCRALVMYADNTKSITNYNQSMTVAHRTNMIGRHHWLTTPGDTETISWKGGYGNPYIESNNYAAPIRDMTYADGIDYTQGNISTSGTPNKRGITKFQYATVARVQTPNAGKRRKRDITPPTTWLNVPGEVSDEVTFIAPDTGDAMTFWVQAQDMLGNTINDFSYIRVDDTPPLISNPVFRKNVPGPQRGYYSSVDMVVIDSEGGVFRIDSSVYKVDPVGGDADRQIGSASQPGQTMQDAVGCIANGTCVCTSADECFARVQRVYIGNCDLLDYRTATVKFNATVYNMALLSNTVELDLGVLSELSGIDEYPPPYSFAVKRTYGTGADLTWYLPGACYPIESIKIDIEGGEADMPKLGGGITEVEIGNLIPNRMYTAYIYITYVNRKVSDRVKLEFDTGPPPPGYDGGGLTVGAIVGIVVGVLVLLLIIIVIVLVVVRVRVKHQPAVPRRLAEVGGNIKDRISRKFGHSVRKDPWDESGRAQSGTVLNVAYTGGCKLKYSEDDVYAYGEMETDPEANWKHSNDHVVLGKAVHTGRFAEIRKGSLSNKEGTRAIAVKMLRESTNENVLLMKAKMNFLATGVPHHNNIVNFVGAVTEGPLLLLEYCDQPLKDWLKSINKMTDDIEDNMTNFCTDTARGMQHLHDNEIIHRRLGARNILLKNVPMMGRLVAKVTGFGPMKGEMASTDGGPERIPIKWMAPEQLGLGKKAQRPYTYPTDVWSFGITVWEIYSRGKGPFAEQKHSEIKGILDSGIRPRRPDDCSEELYAEVMMKCWEQKPAVRPEFDELRMDLERLFHGAPDGEDYYDDQYGTGEMYDDTAVNIEFDDQPPTYTDARVMGKR